MAGCPTGTAAAGSLGCRGVMRAAAASKLSSALPSPFLLEAAGRLGAKIGGSGLEEGPAPTCAFGR